MALGIGGEKRAQYPHSANQGQAHIVSKLFSLLNLAVFPRALANQAETTNNATINPMPANHASERSGAQSAR